MGSRKVGAGVEDVKEVARGMPSFVSALPGVHHMYVCLTRSSGFICLIFFFLISLFYMVLFVCLVLGILLQISDLATISVEKKLNYFSLDIKVPSDI